MIKTGISHWIDAIFGLDEKVIRNIKSKFRTMKEANDSVFKTIDNNIKLNKITN